MTATRKKLLCHGQMTLAKLRGLKKTKDIPVIKVRKMRVYLYRN